VLFQRIDHIGVVVDSLADAQRWLGEVFRLPIQRTVEIAEGRIRAAFYSCGDAAIEVLEIGDPEVRRRRLGPDAQARIEHIAVEVENLQAALASLAPLGVRTTEPEPRRVGDNLNVWTVAETTGGVSYQLVQKPRPK
jgi:methylmalonyl-CoA/ethylmalonyl-CoA epimerase